MRGDNLNSTLRLGLLLKLPFLHIWQIETTSLIKINETRLENVFKPLKYTMKMTIIKNRTFYGSRETTSRTIG